MFGLLAVPNMTKSRAEITSEIHTDRRIPMPKKTGFAGGNAWVIQSLSIQNE
jgi:hypothetical protein